MFSLIKRKLRAIDQLSHDNSVLFGQAAGLHVVMGCIVDNMNQADRNQVISDLRRMASKVVSNEGQLFNDTFRATIEHFIKSREVP
jgi:hypothetical protein